MWVWVWVWVWVMLGFEKDMGLGLRVLECLGFQTNFFFKFSWAEDHNLHLYWPIKLSKSHLSLVQYADGLNS